jgi:hypothetical protein
MSEHPHTQLICAPDGPWITIRGEESILTFNLRELVRDLMPAERYSDRRHTMAQWLKARDAEGKPELTGEPPTGNERKPIPASRRILPTTAKR